LTTRWRSVILTAALRDTASVPRTPYIGKLKRFHRSDRKRLSIRGYLNMKILLVGSSIQILGWVRRKRFLW
jgi:hypothetical protein